MRESRSIAHRTAARDDGIRRLRRTTVFVVVGAGVAALGAGELAARSLPGRSASHTTTTPQRATKAAAPAKRATPPTLVPAGAPAPAPAPPASAPVQSAAPPVVSSGGT
jgi:hypothetical protein